MGGRSWVPSDHYARSDLFGAVRAAPFRFGNDRQYDIIEYNHNRAVVTAWAFERGEFPLWDPTLFFGQPLIAQASAVPLYPPRLALLRLMEPDRATTWLLWMHLWLAGAAMYVLARRLGIGPAGAAAAGVVWMFAGSTAAGFKYDDVLPHLAWLPLVLAAVERISTRSALWGSLALSMAVLGGYPYVHIVSALFLSIYAACRLRTRAAWARWGLLVGAALLVCAPQLVPAVGHALRSPRFASGGQDWNLQPGRAAALVTMVAPRLLGGPAERASLYRQWQLPDPLWFQLYVGLIPLLGIAAAGRRVLPRFFVVGAGATLLLLLVHPLNAAVHLLIPTGLAIYDRMAYLFALCAAVIGGAAVDALARDPEPFRRRLTIAARIGSGAVALALAGAIAMAFGTGSAAAWLGLGNDHVWQPILFGAGACALLNVLRSGRPRAFAAGAVLLAAAEMLPPFRAFNPTFDGPLPAAVPEAIRFLSASAPHARTAASFRNVDLVCTYPNLPAAYRLRTAGGYDDFVTRRYQALASALGGTTSHGAQAVGFPNPDPARLGRAGIEYALDGPALKPIGGLPRLFVAAEAAAVESGEAALRRLLDPAVELRRTVLIEQAAAGPPGGPGAARFLDDGFNRVTVEVDAPDGGWLVLMDAYDPDWICRIGAEPLPIVRANYLFRAVRVPPGRHVVEFRYRPMAFFAAAALSIATLAAVGIALAPLRR